MPIFQAFFDQFFGSGPKQLIAQIIGFAGIIANFLIYQAKDRIDMLKRKRLADAVWLLVYLAFVWAGQISALAGAGPCVVAMIRETVFLHSDKKWAKSKLWLIGFVLLFFSSSFITQWISGKPLTRESIKIFLPAIASTLAVFSFWLGKPRVTRKLVFPISGLMIVYDVIIASLAGILNETIAIVSAVIGIIRHDIRKTPALKPESDPESNPKPASRPEPNAGPEVNPTSEIKQ